jgi:TolA-binding protein
MSRDLLDDATRALREKTDGDDGGGRFTRARVMASLHQGRVRRRTRLALLLPIAATLAAASAWGVGSESGRAIVRQVGESLGLIESRVQPLEAAPKKKPQGPAVRAGTPPAITKSLPEPPSPPAPQSEPSARPAAPSAAAVNAAEERELSLYRAAHRAHFIDRDFAAALSGWSDYLSKVPSGRFALEARYNRALCLVQLGRKSEARTALEPFARGAFGAYRQREARELLQALTE